MSKYIGNVFSTNNSGDLEILEYINYRKVIVKFLDTGYERTASMDKVKLGKVKDPYAKTVYSVACIGEGKYNTKSRAFNTWKGMLARCYYKLHGSYPIYGGAGVTVCEDWLNFQNFAKWYDTYYIEGYYLDKDMLKPNKRQYSPETCVFVPRSINNLLVKTDTAQGYRQVGNSFIVQVNKGNASGYSGSFKTKEEARAKYVFEKEKYVRELAEEYYKEDKITEEVYKSLMRYKVPENINNV